MQFLIVFHILIFYFLFLHRSFTYILNIMYLNFLVIRLLTFYTPLGLLFDFGLSNLVCEVFEIKN